MLSAISSFIAEDPIDLHAIAMGCELTADS
jgi:hypothetical protein